jgi:hypothetical protein
MSRAPAHYRSPRCHQARLERAFSLAHTPTTSPDLAGVGRPVPVRTTTGVDE